MVLKDADRPGGTLAEVGRYGGYGITLGIATALFAWIGSILDERFHTGPLFVLLGTFTGFGAAFYSMYRHLMPNGGGDAGPDDDGRDRDGDVQ